MNTKQGSADFRFYFSPKLSSVKTAEEGLDFSFPFPSLVPLGTTDRVKSETDGEEGWREDSDRNGKR